MSLCRLEGDAEGGRGGPGGDLHQPLQQGFLRRSGCRPLRWGTGLKPSSVGGHIHSEAVAVFQKRSAFRSSDSTVLYIHGG